MTGQKTTVEEKLNRAKQIAEFILEGGHLVDDVLEEFRICKNTYLSDMRFLYHHGYGEELKRNRLLYMKTRMAINNEIIRRRNEKGE